MNKVSDEDVSSVHDEIIEYIDARERFTELRSSLGTRVHDVTEVLNSVLRDHGTCIDDKFGWDIDVIDGETAVCVTHTDGVVRHFSLGYLKYYPVHDTKGRKNSRWKRLELDVKSNISKTKKDYDNEGV